MKINHLNNKKNGGYAILFTVAVVGIISMITIGLSNAAYKQMILSSVAKDSAKAFYEADIASECALYADDIGFYDSPSSIPGSTTFDCAGHILAYNKTVISADEIEYTLEPESPNQSEKCFYIKSKKTNTVDALVTVIESKGYNICNTDNIRAVERAIRVTY